MNENKNLVLAAVAAALYVVLNLIPIGMFIGAGGIFIPLSIIFVPVMAWLLEPREALIASIIGGLGSLIFNPSGTGTMGVFAIMVPVMAITVGSITLHMKSLKLAATGWIIIEFVFYYAFYNGQATIFWGVHYAVASLCAIIGVIKRSNSPYYYVPSIAMAENAALNVYSILIAGLPAELWQFIIISSIYERIIATVGAILLIKGLKKAIPQWVPE